MEFTFDTDKSLWLKETRGVSFEEVILLINEGLVVEVIEFDKYHRHAGEKIYVVDIGGYAYLVPYEDKGDEIELKTIYPSRKATKKFLESYEKQNKK